MGKKEKAPVLRFKDTDGKDYPAWEQRKLNELGTFNPKSVLPEEFEYVDLESVVGTELLGHRKETLSTAPSRAQRLASKGDIFFQTVRPYQKNNYFFEKEEDNFVFSTGYAQLRPSINPYFLFNVLQTDSFVKRVLDNCTGSSYPAINSGVLSLMPVHISPSEQETEKIGLLFLRLDRAITLHQRKLEALKKLKRTLLQKMFPKKGQLNPELRFPGFTNDWEQRKFQEITQRVSTSSISSIDFPSVEYEDIEAGSGTLNKDVKVKDKNKKGIVFDKNDILFGKLRPYLMNWLLADFKGVAVGDFWVLRSQNFDPKFVYSLIQTKSFQEVANRSSGSKMPRADWNLVSNTLFFVPSQNNEQRKIGEVFSSLDKVITLHQRKLETYKKLKKGLLQKMFI